MSFRYDQALQYMQRRFDNINQTFTDYEKNTIQPVQVREARMHYIESQIKEQEQSREIEYDHLKDLIMKLLLALEQSVFISGTDCVAITKKLNVKRLNQYKSNAISPRGDSLLQSSKSKISNTNLQFNKSMIEPSSESFLPSLTRNIHNESAIIRSKDDSMMNENVNSRDPSPNSNSSSKERERQRRQNLKAIRLNGDKNLLKRILFLKENLERNPLVQNDPNMISSFLNSQSFEPVVLGNSESTASKLVKVAEPPNRKNFFQTPKANSLAGIPKKSHSVLKDGNTDFIAKELIKHKHQHTNSSILQENISLLKQNSK